MKWFPKVLTKRSDGGKDSGVTAYFLIEWKKVFSVGLLHFRTGSREAFHSHAFHALTWWLKGGVTEIHHLTNEKKEFYPSLVPKLTKRNCFHKVEAHQNTWALTFRGPWKDVWQEYRPTGYVTLTHGRQEIN